MPADLIDVARTAWPAAVILAIVFLLVWLVRSGLQMEEEERLDESLKNDAVLATAPCLPDPGGDPAATSVVLVGEWPGTGVWVDRVGPPSSASR